MQPDPRSQETRFQTSQDPWRTTQHVAPPASGVPTQPQQYAAPPGSPQRKRSHTGLIVGIVVLGGLLAVGALVLVAMVGASPPATHTVRFEVTASEGQVTLVNWSTLEDSAIVRNPALPWTHEVELETTTGIVGVNVSGTGTVACKVWVDGKLVDEGESAGAVHCGATVR